MAEQCKMDKTTVSQN